MNFDCYAVLRPVLNKELNALKFEKSGANLFLVAAPRSGSSNLSHTLALTSKVGRLKIKEPNFFASHEYSVQYVRKHSVDDVPIRVFWKRRNFSQFSIFRRKAEYSKLYELERTRYMLDASTTNSSCVTSARAIFHHNFSSRIIFLTRSRKNRSISHFLLTHRIGRTRLNLMEELEFEIGEYDEICSFYLLRLANVDRVERSFFSIFPVKNTSVVEFSNLIDGEPKVLSKLSSQLDLKDQILGLQNVKTNSSVSPRFPLINFLLFSTGMKTMLRLLLPSFVKGKLRNIWFRSEVHFVLSVNGIKVLSKLLK